MRKHRPMLAASGSHMKNHAALLSILFASVAIAQSATQPDFAIRPYLAACSQTEATVGWTTTAPAEFTLRYGKGEVTDATLPRKFLGEFYNCSYRNPTQVDNQNMVRRSRESSLRNSAK